MAAIDFPNNPALDDTFTDSDGKNWKYDGDAWFVYYPSHTHYLVDIIDSKQMAEVDDAPADGKVYGRKNNTWAPASAGWRLINKSTDFILSQSNLPSPLYNLSGGLSLTVQLTADAVDGDVFAFTTIDDTPIVIDEATNTQTLISAPNKIFDFRGNGSIIVVTYLGSSTWLGYGDLGT